MAAKICYDKNVELVRTGRIAMVRGVVRPAGEASSLRKVAGAKA